MVVDLRSILVVLLVQTANVIANTVPGTIGSKARLKWIKKKAEAIFVRKFIAEAGDEIKHNNDRINILNERSCTECGKLIFKYTRCPECNEKWNAMKESKQITPDTIPVITPEIKPLSEN